MPGNYRALTEVITQDGVAFCGACCDDDTVDSLTYKGTETDEPKAARCGACSRELYELVR